MKNNNSKKLIYLTAFSLFLIFVGIFLGIFIAKLNSNSNCCDANNLNYTDDYLKNLKELSTEDFFKADIKIDNSILLLKHECYELSMEISQEQIIAIASTIQNVTFPRPLTSDLLSETMEHFGIEILSAKITNAKDDLYYAEIIVKQGNRILSLDSRPSDAVAIALKNSVPVYVKKDIFEKNGRKIC